MKFLSKNYNFQNNKGINTFTNDLQLLNAWLLIITTDEGIIISVNEMNYILIELFEIVQAYLKVSSFEVFENFFNEIRNFSKKFRISNEKVQHFWSIIVNCLSGFLIKKGYQNSRNKHDQYLNDKFDEYKEKQIMDCIETNKFYGRSRRFERAIARYLDIEDRLPTDEHPF